MVHSNRISIKIIGVPTYIEEAQMDLENSEIQLENLWLCLGLFQNLQRDE